MALAGGLLARSHGARDFGASGHFCAGDARFARVTDDSIFLPCWTTRIPRVDDARVVVRVCDRFGSLPRIDWTALVINRRRPWPEALARSAVSPLTTVPASI